jgi:hypothetical protein
VSATFHPDFRWGSLQLLEELRWYKTDVPVIWRGRAALVGAVILFVSLGFAVGWMLHPFWVAAAFLGSIVAASSLWAVDTWGMETFSPGVMMYLLTTASAELGVGLVAWDWSRMASSRS